MFLKWYVVLIFIYFHLDKWERLLASREWHPWLRVECQTLLSDQSSDSEDEGKMDKIPMNILKNRLSWYKDMVV